MVTDDSNLFAHRIVNSKESNEKDVTNAQCSRYSATQFTVLIVNTNNQLKS